MSTPQRLVAVVVGALVLLIAAVLVLHGTGAPIGLGQDVSPRASQPTPTTSPSPETTFEASASPSASESGAIDADLEALAEIEEQVEEIRGLQPADIGPPEILTREQVRVELQEVFDADYPLQERAADNIALRALGLLEPDQDYAEEQLELLGEGVLGFYDELEERMVVVSDAGLDAQAKMTYAHEYTHALQDAAFPDAFAREPDEDDDVALARLSLTEGDAQTTMLLWAIEHLSPDELIEIANAPLPDTTGVPSWMLEVLLFPYTEGLGWVQLITAGGTDLSELDAAYENPPTSTEQILDVQKWLDREEPIVLDDPPLSEVLGDGWEVVETTTIGQAFLRSILTFLGEDPDEAVTAADGWGGDRVAVASGPNEAFALAWRLAWDRPGDADDFAASYERVSAELDFPTRLVTVSETEQLVLHASSQDVLDAVVGGLD